MPGARLGRQERERIASALAEGFGCAEIARELGRPTSTITREVARNGGPAGYRADDAHRATLQRARRPRPAPAGSPDRRLDTDAVAEFRERFAALMVRTGVPRMAARVLACLFVVDSGALTPAELVERLRVSPASVSKAVGFLAGLDLVRRERLAPGRRERYAVDDDVWLRSWTASAQSQQQWADTAREGAELLGPATPAGARLAGMDRFFRSLAEDMAGGPSAAALDDALTALAALLHAGVPLAVPDLAAALGWPRGRVLDAVRDAETRPDVTDPVVVRWVGPDVVAAAPAPERLTGAQRAALDRAREDAGVGRSSPPGRRSPSPVPATSPTAPSTRKSGRRGG